MILDLLNQRFGSLMVVGERESIATPAGSKVRVFECICDCGNRSIVRMGNLRSGHTTSCGCKRVKNDPRLVDRTGQSFGALTITGVAKTRGIGSTWWQCACQCGGSTQMKLTDIRQQKDCGCRLAHKDFPDEDWACIDGLAGRYMVSTFGRVKSVIGNRDIIMTPFESRKGYLYISLYRPDGSRLKTTIHRLVAKAFLVNHNQKPAVNHIDCDKKNNHVNNLEWVTFQENTDHAKDHNLLGKHEPLKGSRNKMAKLTEEKVKEIRRLSQEMSAKEICKIFGVDKSTISLVISRKTWRHVQ